MTLSVPFSIASQTFILSPLKCIFWESKNALIVSDLHLGKTAHFRKNGLAIPSATHTTDLQNLFSAIQYFKPLQVIIVGDMVHSNANNELDNFCKWRNDIADTKFILIKGNHDILPNNWYVSNNIDVYQDFLVLDNICFQHDIPEALQENYYYITGHIHPGVVVKNNSRQSLRMPCFYFTHNYAVLPAFSAFTGLHMVKIKKNDAVFAIINNQIVQL